MSIDANELHALPDSEKLRIVEMLWNDLGESTEPIPLPDWAGRELRYHPLFDCDVREAAGWYDRRSPGLGDAFVDLVAQCVAASLPIRSGSRSVQWDADTNASVGSRTWYCLTLPSKNFSYSAYCIRRSMEKWRERLPDT